MGILPHRSPVDDSIPLPGGVGTAGPLFVPLLGDTHDPWFLAAVCARRLVPSSSSPPLSSPALFVSSIPYPHPDPDMAVSLHRA